MTAYWATWLAEIPVGYINNKLCVL
jgi:hypothetical protein